MKKEISPKRGRYLFDGGLSTKFEKTIIGENESPDCLNVVFANGAVGTRPGHSKLNTTAVGSFVCDGLYVRHTNSGNETMIVFAGGSAWSLNGTSTFATIPSAQSVYTAGVRVGAAEYQQHIFVGNGFVVPYKYNGTDWTRHGVYPPTTTSTVATSSAGTLTGDYRYKVTFRNSQSVESDVGPVTSTHTAGSTRILITSIPTAAQSYGIDARRIYRTVAGGSEYKLVTTLNDNSTTSFEDNISDSALGVTAPADHGVPPFYNVICYHRDRLFTNDPANPNLVAYSDLTEPYTYGAANFWRFGDNTDDIVRAVATDGENIAVFGDKSIDIRYMPDTDDTNWVTVKTNSPYGCKSPYGIIRCSIEGQNGLLFPAVQNDKFVGFGFLIGNQVAPTATLLTVASAGADLVSDKIEPDMYTIKEGDLGEISAMVFRNKALISVPYDVTATENNRVYMFDFSISNLSKNTPYAWAPWSGIYPAQFAEYGGSLYFGDGRGLGQVWRQVEGQYRDDTSAIDSYYWTKEFGGEPGDFNFYKDFRYANLLVDLAGDYFMNFTARTDSDTGSGNTQQIDLDPGGSLWGTMVWGNNTWGGGSSQREVRMDLGTLSGKRIQFRFDNQETLNQRFKVHGLNYLANVKGFR
jgi:hypothetical protein